MKRYVYIYIYIGNWPGLQAPVWRGHSRIGGDMFFVYTYMYTYMYIYTHTYT